MGKHTAFILRPIEKILDDAASAIGGVCGISRVPLNEYFLQSVFLKMTGEQEQKMKCICWELATEDYEYRYERYNGKWDLGECSTIKDKNKVYNDIYKKVNGFGIDTKSKRMYIDDAKTIIQNFYTDARLYIGNERKFVESIEILSRVNLKEIFQDKDKRKNVLVENRDSNSHSLFKIYDFLYRHRNRCAHNTLSYQDPSVTLNKLQSQDGIYENYFLYFALLIIIDKIFIETYKSYIDILEKKSL